MRCAIVRALAAADDFDGLMSFMKDQDEKVRLQVLDSVEFEDRGPELAKGCLSDSSADVRTAALGVIVEADDSLREQDKKLLSRDLDGIGPWVDPLTVRGSAHIKRAYTKLGMSRATAGRRLDELLSRYKANAKGRPRSS